MPSSGAGSSAECPGRQVVIVQAAIAGYRVTFFKRLAMRLERDGVRLLVLHGPSGGPNLLRSAHLPDEIARSVPNRWLFGQRLLYQPVLRHIDHADLIIVEPAHKHLANLGLALAAAAGRIRLAFWGHGRNRRVATHSLRELLRRTLARRADRWFAYTAGTAAYLRAVGVRDDLITIATNTTDTSGFAADLRAVTDEALAAWRRPNGIPDGATVGLFCGSLYHAKALDFLVRAAYHIRALVPTFHVIIAGDGPDARRIRASTQNTPWIHCLGEVTGRRKALAFRSAAVFLHPGSAGLAIVDAFLAGLPFVTTDRADHGPEIEYLDPGVNAVIAPADTDGYAHAVVQLLNDPSRRAAVAEAASRTAAGLSCEGMVEAFAGGILACLAHPPRRMRRRWSDDQRGDGGSKAGT